MNISHAISQLHWALEKYGDLELVLFSAEMGEAVETPIKGLMVATDDWGEPSAVLVIDQEVAKALCRGQL